jgi:hypothetical protein
MMIYYSIIQIMPHGTKMTVKKKKKKKILMMHFQSKFIVLILLQMGINNHVYLLVFALLLLTIESQWLLISAHALFQSMNRAIFMFVIYLRVLHSF